MSNPVNLITIILSLLLAMAFFSRYAIDKLQKEVKREKVHRVALETFIFGIFSITFLYLSQISSLNYVLIISAKIFGYIFTSYFILFYLGFLIYPLIKRKSAPSRHVSSGIIPFLKEFFHSTTFLLSTAIILIISIITNIILLTKLTH